jgi:hypothetical protein
MIGPLLAFIQFAKRCWQKHAKQDRNCMYDITLKCVAAAIVAVEKQ